MPDKVEERKYNIEIVDEQFYNNQKKWIFPDDILLSANVLMQYNSAIDSFSSKIQVACKK